ncbi:hypothetical protein BCE75_11425 [Isoptericola sp. CG 20/1183]|uniref:DUF1269 domain-containing protein n=1 Tax=Isoptericola halotolerans TaxID=300560 RepID=A0ABX5EA36_9MICO|nr:MULTISPECIES: DUF6325 family protein [Isoptericola]MCK0118636.1 DUF6325 family protein [Isoptericola sp. S6320L]PRZ03213.1 hypothetical protein BCE75_11425 [Isoptericola sp. CG 20/1183]PRZ03575.1 hypothetical protein BCL65_11376 [Isoptericola halotolerans]
MTAQDVGPIDYLAVEFPGAKLQGKGLMALLDLVERGIIRILDLRVAKVTDAGDVVGITLSDLDDDGELDLVVFEGARSGLLDDDDLAEGAALVAPGNAVALLVYENTWAGPFVTAMREAGAEVVASGRIPADDVVSALDALESPRPA